MQKIRSNVRLPLIFFCENKKSILSQLNGFPSGLFKGFEWSKQWTARWCYYWLLQRSRILERRYLTLPILEATGFGRREMKNYSCHTAHLFIWILGPYLLQHRVRKSRIFFTKIWKIKNFLQEKFEKSRIFYRKNLKNQEFSTGKYQIHVFTEN